MTTSQPPVSPGSMQELSVQDCWTLLRGQVVGRLAVVHDDRPDIFPVNYVVDQGSVIFRTGSGTLFSSAAGRPVAFEVDGYDVEDATAWSVVIRGHAREMHDIDEILDVLQLPLLPWHAGPKPRVVRVEPDSVSGRRLFVRGGFRVGSSTDAPA
jgi:nitroimidazol reductase NimA-like FMN-containing flavoprotein (pyridoxamine 5'-phosphate oxidase superfamily)